MAKYITRIQLQDAEPNDFKKLDSEMEKEWFIPVKKNPLADEGDFSRSNEYNCEGRLTLQQVTTAVYLAAKKTGKQYSFTVMKEKKAATT